MSFLRHEEIFPSDGGASFAANASAHRLDEFPAGYSLAVCSPAWPASASPASRSVQSSCLAGNRKPANRNLSLICLSHTKGALQATQSLFGEFPTYKCYLQYKIDRSCVRELALMGRISDCVACPRI